MEELVYVIRGKLLKKLWQSKEEHLFSTKAEYFAVLTRLLPSHYFENSVVVRLIWELWLSI
jgi:hypothetical protein